MNNKHKLGSVLQLFISKIDEKKHIPQEFISIDEEGIIGDKFYNKNNERAILLSSIRAYELMKEKDISSSFGALGENILVDFNPYDLEEGTQLSIGNTILQITIECTICDLLTKINNKVPKLLKKDRGVFAKVIQKGTITNGEEITILN